MQNPKPRRKPDPPAKSCGTCAHCEPSNEIEGICFGVLPKALMKLDGTVSGAFPPVKLTWRCPNWERRV